MRGCDEVCLFACCFFRLSSVKNYFSIVAFQKTPVSLENLNHFSEDHHLTPMLRHFENFSLTVFLKKLKKEQFDRYFELHTQQQLSSISLIF
jgi:hypothetical protein